MSSPYRLPWTALADRPPGAGRAKASGGKSVSLPCGSGQRDPRSPSRPPPALPARRVSPCPYFTSRLAGRPPRRPVRGRGATRARARGDPCAGAGRSVRWGGEAGAQARGTCAQARGAGARKRGDPGAGAGRPVRVRGATCAGAGRPARGSGATCARERGDLRACEGDLCAGARRPGRGGGEPVRRSEGGLDVRFNQLQKTRPTPHLQWSVRRPPRPTGGFSEPQDITRAPAGGPGGRCVGGPARAPTEVP
jgi:hypothetical protein